MTREEAEEYAKTMSYRQAVYNAMAGKCVPYRKATAIKLRELLALADELDKIKSEIMQVANEEKSHDARWALGLRYAVNIIDKYRKEQK